MRLSNRVFKSYGDILDHCCFAWNKLIGMPWNGISVGSGRLGPSVYSARLGINLETGAPSQSLVRELAARPAGEPSRLARECMRVIPKKPARPAC